MATDSDIDALAASITRCKGAPESTLEALMYSLRFGIYVLDFADTRERLAKLDANQLDAACARVSRFPSHIGKCWSAKEIALLRSTWGEA